LPSHAWFKDYFKVFYIDLKVFQLNLLELGKGFEQFAA
jgi:hypothetical protein